MKGASYVTSPTMDCFTGALMLREQDVCANYRRGSPALSPVPTPTELVTPTSFSGPPPCLPPARRPRAAAPRPLAIVRRAAVPPHTARSIRGRPLSWSLFAAFAVGAALTALVGLFFQDASLHIAVFACTLAGVVTVEAVVDARTRARAGARARAT